ncbi:MAG TPA: hypothetical protein VLH10_17895, partial [Yinghuangia sp.]|nr:hypothetical protein [Yinghuangia sp.]
HTGHPQPAAPPGTRRLRVAYCPGSLRAALTADVIRRAAERHHLVVQVTRHDCTAAGLAAPSKATWHTDPMRFNIHPAQGTSGPDDPSPDIHVTPAPDHIAPPPRVLLVVPADPGPQTPEAAAWQAADPLALRLALLARESPDSMPLSEDDLARTTDHLGELRTDVAHFAESPSAAPPAGRIAEVHAAVDDNLGTLRALNLTDALRTDPGIPPGARFEALIHLDRTFGLDLARDIGR